MSGEESSSETVELSREVDDAFKLRVLDREAGLTLLYLSLVWLFAWALPGLTGPGFKALGDCLFWLFGSATLCAAVSYLAAPSLAHKLCSREGNRTGRREGGICELQWKDSVDWSVQHPHTSPHAEPSDVEVAEQCLVFRTTFKALLVFALVVLWLVVDKGKQSASGIVLHTIAQTGFSVVVGKVVVLAMIDVGLVVGAYLLGSASRFTRSGLAFWLASLATQLSRAAVYVFCGLAWLQFASWYRWSFFSAILVWAGGCLVLPQLHEWWQYLRNRKKRNDDLRRVASFGYLFSAGVALALIALTHQGIVDMLGVATVAVLVVPIWAARDRQWRRVAYVFSGVAAIVVFAFSFKVGLIRSLLGAGVLAISIRLVWWLLLAKGEGRRFRVELERSGPIPAGLTTLVYLVVLVGLVAVPQSHVLASRSAARVHDARFRAEVEQHREPLPGSVTWSTAIFSVSDSQIRSFGGATTGAHLQIVEDFVTSSLRPAVQDLLSLVTLRAFADRFRTSKVATAWVYLGDFAEIGCKVELDHFEKLRSDQWFGQPPNGVAVGNHDAFFLGNFMWAPDWEDVCDGEPASHDSLREVFYAEDAEHVSDRSFLAAVNRIDDDVFGIYLDTSDYDSHFVGAAGVAGEITEAQCDWVKEKARSEIAASDKVLIFLHHPTSDLADGKGCIEDLASEFRVQAVVSAHSHLSALRYRPGRHCELVARRKLGDGSVQHLCVPEFVVGSTTDAPQEAAWIRLGRQGGRDVVGFETVQPVRRESAKPHNLTGYDVAASTCLLELEDLETQRGSQCDALLDDRDWFDYDMTPDDIRAQQRRTMGHLVGCLVERGATCSPGSDSTFAKARECIDEAYKETETRELMLCLSWGAAAYAEHSIRLRSGIRGAMQPHQRDSEWSAPPSPFRCLVDPENGRLPVCTTAPAD